MKKILLGLLVLLLMLGVSACGRNKEEDPTFHAQTFVNEYNTAAALTGAPLLALSELEVIAGTETEDGVADSLMVNEGTLNIGALMIQPERIWSSGRPYDLDQATAEFTAIVMGAAGLKQEDADVLVDQLLSTEESEFSVTKEEIAFTIKVMEGNIISLTAESAKKK